MTAEDGTQERIDADGSGEPVLRRGPFHEQQRDLGAVFYDLEGWEGVRYYRANEARADDHDFPAGLADSPAAAVEHLATRERVGLYDMTPMMVVELRGPGVDDYVQRLFTNDMAVAVGRNRYTAMLDEDGRILADPVVSRVDDDRYLVVTLIGAEGRRTVEWMRAHAPADVAVINRDSAFAGVGLWGPAARDVLAPLTDQDLSNDAFPYFRTRQFAVDDVPVTGMRLSFAGELGWELWTRTEYGSQLWDALWAAGQGHDMVPLGVDALVTMGAEKCYRVYGWDVTDEHTPAEAGLDFVVDMDTDFVGREALERVEREGIDRRLATITLDEAAVLPEAGADIAVDGTAVGEVVRAEYGYTIGQAIVVTFLPVADAEPGTAVEVVGTDGRRLAGTVREEPIFDPEGERLTG